MIVTDKVTGQEYDFPDSANPDQIKTYLLRERQTRVAAQGPPPTTFAARALAERQTPQQTGGVGYGLAQGINAAAGIPGDLMRLGGTGLEWLGSKVAPQATQAVADWARNNITLPPGSAQVMAANPPPMAPPTTPSGKFAAGVAQYVPGGMIGGMPGVLSGIGGGLGAQTAKTLDLPPWAQTAAGIVGGTVPSAVRGIAGLVGPQATKQAVQAMRETPPETLSAGQDLMQQAQKRGIALTPGEATAPEVGMGPVGELQARAAKTPEGAKAFNEFMQQRPSQVRSAVSSQLAKLGPEASADDIVSATSQVAQDAIKVAEGHRNVFTRDLYQAAANDQIPPQQVAGLVDSIDAALDAAAQGGSPTSSALQALRGMLMSPDGPETRLSRLQDIYKTTRDKLQYGPEVSGSLRSQAGIVGPINQQLKQIMVANSPKYAQADALYQELSKPIEAMRNGFVGQIAEATTPQQLRSIMFDPENSASRVPEIARLFRQYGSLDTLGSWVRHNLAQSFDQAQKATVKGGTNPAFGATWARNVYGTPQQRDLILSYANELDPSGSLGRGMDTTMKILQATGRIPGLGTAAPAAQAAAGGGLRQTAGRAVAGAALAATGLPAGEMGAGYLAANEISRLISRASSRTTPNGLSRVFTDPDNFPKFISLARRDPRSPQAMALAASILGGRAEPEENP